MKRLLLTTAFCLFAPMAVAEESVTPIIFSVVDGETVLLRNVTSTSVNCDPIFESFEALDILEGSSPELTVKAEPGMVNVSATKGPCPKPVPGLKITLTAAGVTESKEVPLTWRVRYNTKNGPWQQTGKFRILMFPKPARDVPPKS
jgi:hypothetical protein